MIVSYLIIYIDVLVLLYINFVYADQKKVLVIINGQMRGGLIAWNSLKQYVLDFYNADLAYLGPPTSEHNILYQRAKYIWEEKEHDDWGEVLDAVNNGDTSWRSLCRFNPQTNKVENPEGIYDLQFLGGVKNCHDGSAGILLAYRYLAYKYIQESSFQNVYDWFIYTRSDYTYLCSPPNIDFFLSTTVYVQSVCGYGGLSDRHTYIPSNLVLSALNITADLVNDWHYYYNLKIKKQNLEILIKEYFVKKGIPHDFFRHTAFTVRADNDSTRWRVGKVHEKMIGTGLKVKYLEELDEASKNCEVWFHFYDSNGITKIARLGMKNGDLIKTGSSKAVYLIVNETKSLIPDSNILTAHGWNTSNIKMISEKDFAEIPDGDPIS